MKLTEEDAVAWRCWNVTFSERLGICQELLGATCSRNVITSVKNVAISSLKLCFFQRGTITTWRMRRLHYTVNSQTIVGSFTFTDFASSCKNFVKIRQFFAELPLTTKTDVFQYGVLPPYWILVKSQ